MPPRLRKEIQLLAAVEKALADYGRPRKNPGKPRPTAVLIDGFNASRLRPADIPRVHHLSLPGAFQYAKITTGSSPKTVQNAKRAFCEKFNGRPAGDGSYSAERVEAMLKFIDGDTHDSRELLRVLKAAQKKLRKGQ